ncbi:MAG TPA: hypothetical protein VFS55_04875 [Dokdonella sp.]|nr:hypothetical protein [Dokdonella sp.]
MNVLRTRRLHLALLALCTARAIAGTPGIDLALTLSTDTTPGTCGDQASLSVMTGTEVNYCYALTNNTGETLAFVTAEQDDIGRFKVLEPHTIAPGETYRYNRIATALESAALQTRWTAFPVAPDYTVAQNDPDRVFGDGFDGGDAGTPVFAFDDIAAAGTPLAIDSSRNATVPVPIGFPFTFYGTRADTVAAGINGGVLFGVEGGYLPYSPTPLPATTLGPALLPLWDTFFQSPGAVYAQTLGDAPGRRFVVEWKDDLRFPATPDGVTFELVLHEADGSIDFRYEDTSFGDPQFDHGLWATAGLNSGAQPALTYSRNAARLQDGLVVRYTPTPATAYEATASAQLDVGKPIIQVTPSAISASAGAGATTTAMLAVGNIGTLPLGWGMGAAATGAPARPVRPGPLGAALPAYAFDQWPTDPPLVTFDALHPDPIVPVFYGMRRIAAADFAGNDFGVVYAIDHWQDELLAVQTTDCACIDQFVHVGWTAPAPEEDWVGMHYDATSNRFWAVSFGGFERRTSHLLRIDPATGASTIVGAIGGIDDPQFGTQVQAIAVSPEGLLYGIDGVTSSLVAIDRNSARASAIGPLGFQVAGADMDFDDATGTLYLLAGDAAQQAESVYTVDTATGHATPVALVGPDGRSNGLSAFAIASVGPCNVRDAVPWLHWDIGGGAAMPGEANDVTLTLDATTLAPGTYTADLCIDNGDNAHPRVIVPVAFEVTAP